MSGLRTLLGAALAAGVLSAPARALDDLPRAFADCAGRFSAQLEHAWLVQDPQADAHKDRRTRFLSLLDALGHGADPDSLNLRIEAKMGHGALLQEARFGTDPARADWAGRHAAAQIAACRLLLLDG